MAACKMKMNKLEESTIVIASWLELIFNNSVFIIDIDFDSGAVVLIGDLKNTKPFRKQLNEMIEIVRNNLDEY